MKTLAPTDLAFLDAAPVRIEASATLTASPARVFESFARASDWPNWFPFMTSARWTKGTGGLGDEREVALTALGRYRERMIAWEPGKRFAFTMIAATSPLMVQMAEDYRLSPAGKGTRIDWVMAARPTTIGRIAAPGMRVLMRRVFKIGGERLERLLSSN